MFTVYYKMNFTKINKNKKITIIEKKVDQKLDKMQKQVKCIKVLYYIWNRTYFMKKEIKAATESLGLLHFDSWEYGFKIKKKVAMEYCIALLLSDSYNNSFWSLIRFLRVWIQSLPILGINLFNLCLGNLFYSILNTNFFHKLDK